MKNIMNVIVALLCVAIIVVVLYETERIYDSLKPRGKENSASIGGNNVWTLERQFDYANTLFSKGLLKESAKEFEIYIERANIQPKELAKVCYRLGNIYMDLYEYEKALKYFYKSEMLDKDADYMTELNQRVVEALEKLGLTSQAEYELAARTSVAEGKPQSNAKVVARIGKREITEVEINKALDRLPAWMRKEYSDKEGRGNFIREYVAREVLFKKASRSGIDKEPEIREQFEELRRELIIQEYFKREFKDKIKIDDSDIRLYYEANKPRYIEPEALKLMYIEVADRDKTEDARKNLADGKGKEIDNWVERGTSFIPGIGEAKDVVENLFLKNKGEISDVYKIKDKLYMFLIKDKRAEYQKSFEEVRQQVEFEYRMKKQNELMQDLLKKALEEQEVEILYVADDKDSDKGVEKKR